MLIPIVLVLNDIVEYFQEQREVPVRLLAREQKLGRGEELEQIHQLHARHQAHGSPVGTEVGNDRQEARVQRNQPVAPVHDDLVQRDADEIGVAPRKQRQVAR
mmetsp:Transcript_1380/g.2601  ORF Transcript_1380/g.2601 Transcript_1380/m.2601 type:complete len:103 (-) Transcript_1380:1611-1919(-)